MLPDEWGAANRTYKNGSGVPGPRDPTLTPYTIAFGREVAAANYSRCVLAMFAQGGKSEMLLDLIGERMDRAPAPILYVGPTKQFLNEQWEPRVVDLLDQAPALMSKVARGKRMTKSRKVINGNPLRLAHAGSSTALKSDPAALALTDEADELMANVKGQGDPLGLIDLRGETYGDFVHAIVSTPSAGPSEVQRDSETGLEFWAEQDPDDLESKIWALWQDGTRYHWAWRCPQCQGYFIPRFSCLEVSGKDWKQVTVADARANARVICPRNGCIIGSSDEKEAMKITRDLNATGVYVAPGQRIDKRGRVLGDPPDSDTASFWVSGLCSPFSTFGDRAADYVAALKSGDQQKVKTVINGGFGELWAPHGGDVPEWEEVRRLALPYSKGDLPEEVVFLTLGVDVQKNRLVYVVRGWGARQESWLIDAGELWGETSGIIGEAAGDGDRADDVWTQLAELLSAQYGGLHIQRAFIDAGFRPGKVDEVPDHRVYEFCRRHARVAFATKGFDHRDKPLSVNRIDVTPRGKTSRYGLDLVRLDSDFMKSWVHQRLRWPEDQPGGWHLYQEITEDYCRQIVSEARVRKPSGGHQWIVKARNNHFLDAEALAFAAAYMLGLQRLPDTARRPGARSPAPKPAAPEAATAEPTKTPPPKRAGGWLERGRGGRGFLG